jgi:hypothetical protein
MIDPQMKRLIVLQDWLRSAAKACFPCSVSAAMRVLEQEVGGDPDSAPKSWCKSPAECQQKIAVVLPSLPRKEEWFAGMYPGICSGCGRSCYYVCLEALGREVRRVECCSSCARTA